MVAQMVVSMRQNALIPPRMYSNLPCGLALPLTIALTFSVKEPVEVHSADELGCLRGIALANMQNLHPAAIKHTHSGGGCSAMQVSMQRTTLDYQSWHV